MSDKAPNILYLLLCLMLVASSLIGMRLKLGQALKMLLAWVAIFAAGFALFAFRSEFKDLGSRLRAELTGAPIVAGRVVRIPIADDGHYWVDALVEGQAVRFLIDSGATTTTVSGDTARRLGLESDGPDMIVSTANGQAVMKHSSIAAVKVGTIERTDLSVAINANDDTNLLGMNFLSTLTAWRIEGNFLVLQP